MDLYIPAVNLSSLSGTAFFDYAFSPYMLILDITGVKSNCLQISDVC